MTVSFTQSSNEVRAARMRRISVVSEAMSSCCSAVALLLVAGMALYWSLTPAKLLLGQAGIWPTGDAGIGAAIRVAGFLVSMLPLGATVFALLKLRGCFQAFARGAIFQAGPIRDLKAFAIAIAASALLKPVAGALLSLLLSRAAAGGQLRLVLQFGSDQILALMLAGAVAVAAWIFAEAIAIAEENAQFV